MNALSKICLVLGAFAVTQAFAAEPTEGPAVDTSTMAPSAAAPATQTDSTAVRDQSPQSARRATSASDRLELDTTVVTGNRELPKVLYIVPWKKADIGDLPAQPFNTLLDEVLTPVDRDVFRREVTYFEAVTERADATQSTSQPQR